MSLRHFFYPESICIAGASTKKNSIGYELVKNIKEYNYQGKMYPVNPKADEIQGIRCYRSISEIEGTIDLAVVAVPKQFTEATIDELLARGVRSIILITAGFKETGEEGAELERKIVQQVREGGARLVGPNCMGVINAFDDTHLNITFVAEEPKPGGMAFLSQSGALGAAVINALRVSGFQFGHFISVGNKADLNENDFISYWQSDDRISCVGCYLESFEDGTGLLNQVMRGELRKPLLILKAGRTASGMKAAQSHTGALGSSDKVVDALLRQFGIIRVETIDELFETAKALDALPLPKGNRVAVVTNAGGPAILAVDRLDLKGLVLSEFSESTTAALKEIVHPEGSIKNPVDLLPGGTPEQYQKVIELLAADEHVDAVVSIFVEPVMVNPAGIIEAQRTMNLSKPLLPVILPLPEFWEEERKMKSALPVFRQPEITADILANLLRIAHNINTTERLNAEPDRKPEGLKEGFLNPVDVHNLAVRYRLPIVEEKTVTPEKLAGIAENLAYPAVLKGIAAGHSHKSDIGAVYTNILTEKGLLIAAEELKTAFKEKSIGLDAFLLQPHIESKMELLLGGFRDPAFGPVIMFGSGGKYVEYIKDTSLRSAYLTDEDIDEMLDETKAGVILSGVRGERGADRKALKALIKNAAAMLLNNCWIEEFDCNPLMLTAKNEFVIVDMRIKASE